MQANKGSSSYGSRSSDVQNNSEVNNDKLRSIKSLSSSSQSHSHSSDREEVSEAAGAAGGGLSVPRPVVRSASAEDVTTHSALTTKFKRERFLKRQPMAVEETEVSPAPAAATGTSAPALAAPKPEAPASPPPAAAPQKLVKQHSHPLLSQSQSSLKEEPQDEPAVSAVSHASHTSPSAQSVSATPARQPSLDPLCGLESVPLLYSSSGPRLSPTNLYHRPVLPTVRIIPDTDGSPGPGDHGMDSHPSVSAVPSHHLSPVTSGPQLYPGHQHLLHPEVCYVIMYYVYLIQ